MVSVSQCVAVCCRMLQCDIQTHRHRSRAGAGDICGGRGECGAVWCGMLQQVAVSLLCTESCLI